MVSCLLGANHSEHCKAVHLNYIPISFGFGMPRLTNPWHIASFLNAKLPIVNWFPLFINQEEMRCLESNARFSERERGEKLRCQLHCMSSLLQSKFVSYMTKHLAHIMNADRLGPLSCILLTLTVSISQNAFVRKYIICALCACS